MDASIALCELGFEKVDFRFRLCDCHAPKSKLTCPLKQSGVTGGLYAKRGPRQKANQYERLFARADSGSGTGICA